MIDVFHLIPFHVDRTAVQPEKSLVHVDIAEITSGISRKYLQDYAKNPVALTYYL